jgi:hypothetical protein
MRSEHESAPGTVAPDDCRPNGALQLRTVGGGLELVVAVQVGAGAGHYGSIVLDAMGVRRLLAELHRELWALEWAEATRGGDS